MHPVSCTTNIHHDVTDLVNQDMVKDTKIWVSWEWNVNFLWNKIILNIYHRWHILRNYRFVAEVIFRSQRYRVWCRSNQIFLPYSHHVFTAKFINSFFKYSKFWGTHKLNGYAKIWPCPPKNHWNNFQLAWICTNMHNISSFHLFILEIQSISESRDQTGCAHFWPCTSKHFLIKF